MVTRTCKKCGETKPLDNGHFAYNRKRDYFEQHCKKCVSARARVRYHSDPDYREKMKAYQRSPEVREKKNAARNKRYANDEEYRVNLLTSMRQKYSDNPDFRERIKERQGTSEAKKRKNTLRRNRYATDEAYRLATLAALKTPERRERLSKSRRERRANDPVWRAKINAQKSTPEARERDNGRRRERRASDHEYRKRQNSRDRERWNTNSRRRTTMKLATLARLYGISKEAYHQKLEEQGGLCAICESVFEKSLAVDHNHKTGEIRGLLCEHCNFGIGKFRDNPKTMESAVRYLRLPQVRPEAVKVIPADRPFARFEIPNWKEQSRDKAYITRRNLWLKNNRNITNDQYEALMEKGNGVCWICRMPETGFAPKVLVVPKVGRLMQKSGRRATCAGGPFGRSGASLPA